MPAWEHRTGLGPITTKKSTSATSTVIRTPVFDGRKVKSVRVGYRLAQSSGDIEVRIFQRTSDGGVAFSSPAAVTGYTSYVSTDGYTYGGSWATVTAAGYIQFGLEARNKTGAKVEVALAELLLDFAF